jgi:3-mercaptopyruvate sulfurtransferase SseA
MQKTKIFLPFFFLALVTLACNALLPLPTEESVQPEVTIPQSENAVHRVSAEEAKAALDSGEAIIVDVRSAEAYEAGHIAGSQFIPLGEFETDISNIDLPKDQWIITYCT